MSRVFFCPKCGAYLPEAAELCTCGSPIVPGAVPSHESHPDEPVGLSYQASAEASLTPALGTPPSPIPGVVVPLSLGADPLSRRTPATIVALAVGFVVVLLTLWLVRDRLFSFGDKVDSPSAESTKGQAVDGSAQQPSQDSTAPLMIENQFLVDTYLGTIGDKDFKLFLEKVNGERVEGHDVAGTNRRPVTGRIVSKRLEPTGLGKHYTVFKLILTEPGDDEWDGEFNLDLWISDVGRHGEGRWTSFNGRLDRTVTLRDRFNATSAAPPPDAPRADLSSSSVAHSGALLARFPDLDSRHLTSTDVASLSLSDLAILRNSIFARHGRPFAKPEYATYFAQFDWYRADPNYRDDRLNSVEKRNVELIAERERSMRRSESP